MEKGYEGRIDKIKCPPLHCELNIEREREIVCVCVCEREKERKCVFVCV